MDKVRFDAFTMQMRALADVIEPMDVEEYLGFLNQMDTVGPIIYPTEWMAGQKNIQALRQMAEALQQFRNGVAAIKRNRP